MCEYHVVYYKFVDKFFHDVERLASSVEGVKSEGAFPAQAPTSGKIPTDVGTVVWVRDSSVLPEFITFVRHGRVFKRKKVRVR